MIIKESHRVRVAFKHSMYRERFSSTSYLQGACRFLPKTLSIEPGADIRRDQIALAAVPSVLPDGTFIEISFSSVTVSASFESFEPNFA